VGQLSKKDGRSHIHGETAVKRDEVITGSYEEYDRVKKSRAGVKYFKHGTVVDQEDESFVAARSVGQ